MNDRKKTTTWMIRIAAAAFVVGGAVLALPGCKDKVEPKPTSLSQPATETAVYTCPMHPEVTQDEPGQCPECGMDLVKEGEEHMHE